MYKVLCLSMCTCTFMYGNMLFQSSEVANSNAMELEGLRRSIAHLQEQGIEVSDFTTDRHPQVKKYMREKHPTVNHWFDVWHVAKG